MHTSLLGTAGSLLGLMLPGAVPDDTDYVSPVFPPSTTYEVERSTNHAERGPTRLIEQFKNQPRFVALLVSYLEQIQEIENAAWEVILNRTIDAAEGVQLDMLGKVVGCPRSQWSSDTIYRLAIRCKIRINRSSGRIPDILDVAKLSLPNAYTFEYRETYPAHIIVTVEDQIEAEVLRLLLTNLRLTKASAVRLSIVYVADPATHENVFRFSDTDSPTVDLAHGFADTTEPADHGLLAGVVSTSV